MTAMYQDDGLTLTMREQRARRAERLQSRAAAMEQLGNHKAAEGLRLRAYNLMSARP